MPNDKNPKPGERRIEGCTFHYNGETSGILTDFGGTDEQGMALLKRITGETESDNAPGKIVEALDRGLIHEWDILLLAALGLNAILMEMQNRQSPGLAALKQALAEALG